MHPFTHQVNEACESAARELHGQYRYWGITKEDLYQDGYLWWSTHPGRVRSICGATWAGEDMERWRVARLRRQFCAVMALTAREAKAAHSGYGIHDEAYYSKAAVEMALPAVWDEGYAESGPPRETDVNAQHGFGKVKQDPRTANMWQTIVLDVQVAYGATPFQEGEAAALQMYYSDGASFNNIGDRLGMTGEGARKLVDRAVGRVAKKLNGDSIIPDLSARLAERDAERVDYEEDTA